LITGLGRIEAIQLIVIREAQEPFNKM